ncbi:hypothetical protein Dimus_025495 [Dionaea muscipula]
MMRPVPVCVSLTTSCNCKKKVVFVLGATGSGKSKLAIELAKHFGGEIINSDKIQVYKGLDIVTNKVSEQEQLAVPHHLLGHISDHNTDYSSKDFAVDTLAAVDSIIESGRLPIVAGGSNSYIEQLVQDPAFAFKARYEPLFIWLDVAEPVLHSYVGKRVDQMVAAGLVQELRQIFEPDADYTRGIRRAIGVEEFHSYFKLLLQLEATCTAANHDSCSKLIIFMDDDEINNKPPEKKKNQLLLLASLLMEEAIRRTKENTCILTVKQVGKIHRLRDELKWNLHRIDATPAFEKLSAGTGEEEEEAAVLQVWNKVVMLPCLAIVQEFLNGNGNDSTTSTTTCTTPAPAADDQNIHQIMNIVNDDHAQAQALRGLVSAACSPSIMST